MFLKNRHHDFGFRLMVVLVMALMVRMVVVEGGGVILDSDETRPVPTSAATTHIGPQPFPFKEPGKQKYRGRGIFL